MSRSRLKIFFLLDLVQSSFSVGMESKKPQVGDNGNRDSPTKIVKKEKPKNDFQSLENLRVPYPES